jgi:hypothetical protein
MKEQKLSKKTGGLFPAKSLTSGRKNKFLTENRRVDGI